MGIIKFIFSGEFFFAGFLMAGFIKGGFVWLPIDITRIKKENMINNPVVAFVFCLENHDMPINITMPNPTVRPSAR